MQPPYKIISKVPTSRDSCSRSNHTDKSLSFNHSSCISRRTSDSSRITVKPHVLQLKSPYTYLQESGLALPVLCIGTQALPGCLFPFLVLGSLASIRLQPPALHAGRPPPSSDRCRGIELSVLRTNFSTCLRVPTYTQLTGQLIYYQPTHPSHHFAGAHVSRRGSPAGFNRPEVIGQ